MKKTFFPFLVILMIIHSVILAQNVIYTSPSPSSELNSEKSTIIIGFNAPVSPQNINLTVTGSVSGNHTGTIKYVENKKKILFIPDEIFSQDEIVTVTGYKGSNNFTFKVRKIRDTETPINVSDRLSKETGTFKNPFPNPVHNSKTPIDSLIELTINNYSETASGKIFLINFSQTFMPPSSLLILNNNGTPYFNRQLQYRGFDFKKQNNYYIYWDEAYYQYKAMDFHFNIVDSFFCGNGYITDFHECVLAPDNSAWLMSYDPEVVDMSQIVPGGKVNALVTGLIIQKIDPDKNVVFQWRSWDYFQITDATHEDLTAYNIDYAHGNSIEIDKDNNILISSRHMDEVTKINTNTGDIIFRLGGKNNEFNFINDTAKFSHQHSARRLNNGNILLFDNGNFHNPPYSRAVEYTVDEINNTAEMVWEYKSTPALYSFAMGNVQRLNNGNTVIGWGMIPNTMSEVNESNNLLMDISMPVGSWSYRVYRYEVDTLLTSSHNQLTNIPSNFSLSQNYPNPFNPVTTIKYEIPSENFVSLKVYNILGNEVYTLVDAKQRAGNYNVRLDASSLATGMYFYKLTAGNYTDVKKMILIK